MLVVADTALDKEIGMDMAPSIPQRDDCLLGSVWGTTGEEAVVHLSPVRRRGAAAV